MDRPPGLPIIDPRFSTNPELRQPTPINSPPVSISYSPNSVSSPFWNDSPVVPELTLEDLAVDNPVEGVAYQVHNAFNNIKENLPKIKKIIGSPNNSFQHFHMNFDIEYSQFMNYLLIHVFQFIINKKGLSTEEFTINMDKIYELLTKLYYAGNTFLTKECMTNMYNWTQFVLRQPDIFQIHYFDCFLQDAYQAYDGPGSDDNTSCVKGIYERLLFSIADACILYCTEFKKNKKSSRSNSPSKSNSTSSRKKRKRKNGGTVKQLGGFKSSYSDCEKGKYAKLIVLFKKEIPDLNDLTKEWAEKVLEKSVGQNMSPASLKQNFIEYVDGEYKKYGLNDRREEVEKRAEQLQYAFDGKIFGGKKRY